MMVVFGQFAAIDHEEATYTKFDELDADGDGKLSPSEVSCF